MKHVESAPPKWLARASGLVLVVALVATLVWIDWKVATAIQTQRLEDHPTGVDLKLTKEHEVVVVSGPGEIALFEQTDSAVDDVEACFTGSRLDTRTREILEVYAEQRPPEEGEISFFTDSFDEGPLTEGDSEDRCRTRIEVALDGDEAGPAHLHAFQHEGCGRGGRALGLRPEGGCLRIRLTVVTPPSGPNAPGCQKILLVGDGWDDLLPAPLALEILVPPGEVAAFEFQGLGEQEDFAPFTLARVRSLELWHASHEKVRLQAHGLGGPGDIRVDRLALLPEDRLRLAISGSGPIDGEPGYLRPQSFQEWTVAQIGAHPFLSVLIAGVNALLATLFVTYLVKRPAMAGWSWLSSRLGLSSPVSDAEPSRDSAPPPLTRPEARGSRSSEATPPPPGRRSSRSPRP